MWFVDWYFALVIYEQQKKLYKTFEQTKVPMPEEWLANYAQKRDERNENVGKVFWSYPQQLESRYDLPPSMKKFQPEYFQDSDFPEWGQPSK